MDAENKKYLRTDVDVSGGYLAPTEYVQEIIKRITEISPVRSVARVRSTNRKSISIPKRLTNVTAQFVGEGQPTGTTQETYGLEVIHVDTLRANVEITWEMLSDAAFNMESEIDSDVVEDYARAEGAAFINGAGVKSPEGILVNPDVDVIDSTVSGSFAPEDLITMTGELKQGYNGSYMFNRRTLAFIRSFTGANGQFIWTPTLAEGEPARINGDPYVLAIDMPDIAVGATPVAYGDWFRGYTVVDGMAMTIRRDDSSKGDEGKVVFRFFKGVGGGVVLAEAMNKLEIIA